MAHWNRVKTLNEPNSWKNEAFSVNKQQRLCLPSAFFEFSTFLLMCASPTASGASVKYAKLWNTYVDEGIFVLPWKFDSQPEASSVGETMMHSAVTAFLPRAAAQLKAHTCIRLRPHTGEASYLLFRKSTESCRTHGLGRPKGNGSLVVSFRKGNLRTNLYVADSTLRLWRSNNRENP